jgi:hypothetical protein
MSSPSRKRPRVHLHPFAAPASVADRQAAYTTRVSRGEQHLKADLVRLIRTFDLDCLEKDKTQAAERETASHTYGSSTWNGPVPTHHLTAYELDFSRSRWHCSKDRRTQDTTYHGGDCEVCGDCEHPGVHESVI